MNQPKSIGQYIFGKTLGQGTFGKVKLGIHQATQEKVAIKVLDKNKIVDAADIQRVQREIQILKQLHHPNLVQLYEIFETPKQLFLVMEYIGGGELFDYIVKNQRLKDQEASKLFAQLISGIEYLHRLKIVHRDLKPENLMLENGQRIKIIDFGLSNMYKDDLLKTACGSPCYAAPEMIAGKRYMGLPADIWSAGVVLFAMLAGSLPFEEQNTNSLYKKILAGEYKCPSSISLPARNLISGILCTDPIKRYTINDIRKHPWMTINCKINNSIGLIVGINRIPIDFEILKEMIQMGYVQEQIEKSIEGNRHNQITTTYYLLLKKFLSQGGKSFADISSDIFNPLPLAPKHASTQDYHGPTKYINPLPQIIKPRLDESPVNLRGRNPSLQQNHNTAQSPKMYSVDVKRQPGEPFKLDLASTSRDQQYIKNGTPHSRQRVISEYNGKFTIKDSLRQKSVEQTNDSRFKTFYRVK